MKDYSAGDKFAMAVGMATGAGADRERGVTGGVPGGTGDPSHAGGAGQAANAAVQLLGHRAAEVVAKRVLKYGGMALGGVVAAVVEKRVATASKAVSLPAWRKVTVDMPHVMQRHVPGAPLEAGRSVFPSNMSERGIHSAIRQAYGNSTKVKVQGADRVLLEGRGGGLTIRIWFNKVTSTIETAFPVGR